MPLFHRMSTPPWWLVNLAILAALVLLIWGLTAPLLTLKKFYVFSNTVSLWSALLQLREQGDWGLFLLLGCFSVLFPLVKLGILFWLANLERDSAAHRRHLRWLDTYGRWSMLDVFVVALLVVTVKLGAIAQVQVGMGIYPFAASVILTMLLSQCLGRSART